MTLQDGVRCTVAEGLATVTFERPDRNNAMDIAMERRYGTLLLELANRRVRSAEDLVQMLDLPVLASISSSRGNARLSGPRRLALGLGG